LINIGLFEQFNQNLRICIMGKWERVGHHIAGAGLAQDILPPQANNIFLAPFFPALPEYKC
jgi:hypothetical protein